MHSVERPPMNMLLPRCCQAACFAPPLACTANHKLRNWTPTGRNGFTTKVVTDSLLSAPLLL